MNPITWAEAIDVANLLGVRAVCMFNDHRERLVASRLPQATRTPGARP
ncbi:MAG: hypothetical protein IT363_09510 [Methanoregulaceae archaeon]|nr:hypothetical protein [Methanoregulaceae archaeon]